MAKKKTQEKKTDKPNVSVEQFQVLRKWNLWLGVVLLLEAVAIIVIGTDRSFPITTQYLAVDTLASEASGGQSLAVATRHLFDIPFAWVVGAFLALFAAGSFVVSLWGRKWYEQRLQAGLNDMRWIIFGVGGAGLLAAVGLLSGIYEVTMLLALKAFMIVGCLGILAAGVIRQRAGDQETRLSHLICGVGTACIIAPVVILTIVAGGALLYGGHIPGFVYGIYGSVVFFLLAIGAITHFRIVRRGRWADAFTVERAFVILGFLGASIVAWQMFAGALQP